MVKKLKIRESVLNENAITDLRSALKFLQPWNRKEAERWLRDSDINIKDCQLIPINKPKGPTIAKKSKWPIIAVDENNEPYWFGNDKYMDNSYGYNNVKQTDAFNRAIEFFQVVPKDESTYKSRSEIKATKTPGKFVDLDRYTGEKRRGWTPGLYDEPKKGTRFLTDEEINLYNPNINRKRYKQALAELGEDRYIRIYDELCDQLIETNDRIHSIDLNNLLKYNNYDSKEKEYRTSARHYTSAINMYYQTVDAFENLHRSIEQLTRWGKPSAWEYDDIKNAISTIKYRLKEVNADLDKMF